MNTQHIILAILSSALFGMNIVLSKYGVQHFPPLLFAALRFGSMIPLIFLFPRPKVPFLTMASISLCWGVFYIGSINYALDNGVDAGTATILTQISTFLGFGLAWLVFKQAPKIEQISGALVGFLGICAIFANTFSAGFSPAVLVLLFAALSFATGNILVKRQGISSPSLAIWVNVYSFVPTLIVSLALEEGQLASVMLAGAFDWMTVFFAGWVSTLIGTQLWMKVVNSYDLNTVLPFRSLVPIFGILFAIVLLDEAYTAETWIGMTLVIIGLLITQSRTLWSKLKPPMAVSTILCATILPSANANQDVIPVVVIGSGCAGLSAAYVTAEYGNETVIFAGPIKGGDLNAKTEVGNWMGIDTTMGEEIISDVMEQIEDFEVR
ncbi:MAG: EamA family transporter, partial [Alphaproteobacteria bacterium]